MENAANRVFLPNSAIAELLAIAAENAKMPLQKALRRASRKAFMWAEEAAVMVQSGRSRRDGSKWSLIDGIAGRRTKPQSNNRELDRRSSSDPKPSRDSVTLSNRHRSQRDTDPASPIGQKRSKAICKRTRFGVTALAPLRLWQEPLWSADTSSSQLRT